MLPQNRMNALRARLTMAGDPLRYCWIQFVGVKGLVMTLVVVGTLLVFGYLTHYPVTFQSDDAGSGKLFSFRCGFLAIAAGHSTADRDCECAAGCADLLVIANDAGLSFEMAMQEITGKWDNELAQEFGRVLSDIRMGQPRRDALTSLADGLACPILSAL